MKCSVEGCEYKLLAKTYCSTHYKRFKKYGDPLIKKELRKPLNFTITKNGCFECTSHNPDSSGYARNYFNGKTTGMHRFVYEEMFGLIPGDLVVRHKCDNRICINPEHLELGTVADNIRDRDERGRHKPLRGSKNGFSKLKEEDVLEIISLLDKGKHKKDIANQFKVSLSSIYAISNKQNWGYLYEQG